METPASFPTPAPHPKERVKEKARKEPEKEAKAKGRKANAHVLHQLFATTTPRTTGRQTTRHGTETRSIGVGMTLTTGLPTADARVVLIQS